MSLPKILAEPFAACEMALLVTGNLDDYEMEGDQLVHRPAHYLSCLQAVGYVILSFAKSKAPKIYGHSRFSEEQQKAISAHLQKFDLHPLPKRVDLDDPNKLRIFLSKLRRLLLTPGSELRFLVHLDYVENLCGEQAGFETPDKIVFSEWLNAISSSPALRRAGGNAILLYLHHGAIPAKLENFYEIECPFPNREETARFIEYVTQRNGYGDLAVDLSPERLQAIVRGLPLKSTERMFRFAAALGKPLEAPAVVKQKGESIVRISEGTLAPIEAGDLTSLDEIIGMPVAKGVMAMYADRLRAGRAPGRSICLTGNSGTCKSLMIYLTAVRAQFNCLKWELTKDSLVGESERKVRKAIKLSISAAPTLIAIDEADKMLPKASQGVSDGGVSSDQAAVIQAWLAREDLPKLGVFVMGTTNAPQDLSTAIQDRFLFLPVIGCIPAEIPDLLRSFVKRREAKIVDADEGLLLEAAEHLYNRLVSPRQMFDIIRQATNLHGPELSCAQIAAVAEDYSGEISPVGIQLAILQSIAMCSFKSWYPWANNPSYPLPDFLEGLVDVQNNSIAREKVYEKIAELRPYAQL